METATTTIRPTSVPLGAPPTAPSMLELGRIVAAAVASPERPELPEPRVTVTVAPKTSGDVAEVTYDVVGVPDDSVLGERLHVFGTPGEKFTLRNVETTYLCRRGVSDGGQRLCL